MIKVLFVCLGNICRSPTAHGVFASMVEQHGLAARIQVDSAGTSGWHHNELPDSRSSAEASKRGYDLSFIRSRQVSDTDFVDQDYILAMDRSNLGELLNRCPQEFQHKVTLFLDFVSPVEEVEVPDPYFGGASGFSHVLDLVEQGAAALLNHIKTESQI